MSLCPCEYCSTCLRCSFKRNLGGHDTDVHTYREHEWSGEKEIRDKRRKRRGWEMGDVKRMMNRHHLSSFAGRPCTSHHHISSHHATSHHISSYQVESRLTYVVLLRIYMVTRPIYPLSGYLSNHISAYIRCNTTILDAI